MMIKDLFAKPIDRDIKGVIKVGQDDSSNVLPDVGAVIPRAGKNRQSPTCANAISIIWHQPYN